MECGKKKLPPRKGEPWKELKGECLVLLNLSNIELKESLYQTILVYSCNQDLLLRLSLTP